MCLDTVKFDENANSFYSSIKSRLRQWLEWQDNLDAFQNYSDSDSELDLELDLAWFQNFHRDVLRGTPYRSDVESIETDLAERYKPRLDAMVSVFEEILPTIAAGLKELMVKLANLQQDLPQKLKDFEESNAPEENERAFLALKARVAECHEFMNGIDSLFENIKAKLGPSSQVPETIN